MFHPPLRQHPALYMPQSPGRTVQHSDSHSYTHTAPRMPLPKYQKSTRDHQKLRCLRWSHITPAPPPPRVDSDQCVVTRVSPIIEKKRSHQPIPPRSRQSPGRTVLRECGRTATTRDREALTSLLTATPRFHVNISISSMHMSPELTLRRRAPMKTGAENS